MLSFDPSRMRLNKRGRAIWSNPPEGTRRGAFVSGLDPATLPGAQPTAWETSPEPTEPEPPAPPPPRETAPLPEPLDPAAAAPRPRPQPRPAAAVETALGGVPLPDLPPEPVAPEQVTPQAPARAPGEPTATHAEPAELPDEASEASLATSEPQEPWSESEVAGAVLLHEWCVNTMLATYPRPYTETERRDLGECMGALLGRYGGGIREHAPLMNFGALTAMAYMSRRTQGCPGCGHPHNPQGARFCVQCGTGLAQGGPCRNAHCDTHTLPDFRLPPGTAYCPRCGEGQAGEPEA